VIFGVAAGAAEKFRSRGTLAGIIPQFQRRAAVASMAFNCGFTLIILAKILTTSFRL
jgi:hypothetical protein